MGTFNIIYRCLEKSFCTNLRNSKLKSAAHQRNTPHLKGLRDTPQKLTNNDAQGKKISNDQELI